MYRFLKKKTVQSSKDSPQNPSATIFFHETPKLIFPVFPRAPHLVFSLLITPSHSVKPAARTPPREFGLFGWGVASQLLFTINMEVENQVEQMEVEEQIMIMIEGLEQPEDDPDLLDVLGSQPQTVKKGSLNYDYQPAQLQVPTDQMQEEGCLKTSNRSTSTCADSQPVRKCTCAKTRCQKNYCECFKLGEACTAECECKDCGNKEKLFLGRTAIKIKCKCLKSHCLKNYCECHNMGMKCGPECKCVECENAEVVVQAKLDYMEMGNYFDHHLYLDI